jgi:protein-S-isoprenylcysteine O-methyltransferase Ste14
MLLLRSIFFTFLQPGTVLVLIPYLLLPSLGEAFGGWHSPVRYAGIPLILIGGAGLLWCIWNFFSTGRGTISPIDPPKHLVVRGLYKYVRNPMYVSVVTVLLGEAILFASSSIFIEALVFFVLANLFVAYYEEPNLRRRFGESYENYLRTVHRWIPSRTNFS